MLQRDLRPAVEVVHLQDIVFRIELIDLVHPELLTLERRQPKHVVLVDAPELGLAVINEVLALTQVEVDDVDAVHLLHVVVVLTAVDILRDEFRGAEEDALEIGVFGLALHLDEQQLALLVLGQDVHAV